MHVDRLPETIYMTFNAINTGGDQGLVAAFSPIFSNRVLFHLKTQKLEARILSVESVAAGCLLWVEFEPNVMEPFLQSGLGTRDVFLSTS